MNLWLSVKTMAVMPEFFSRASRKNDDLWIPAKSMLE